MWKALNICGAALGLHAMAFSALATLEPPRPLVARAYVVEPVLVAPPAGPALAEQAPASTGRAPAKRAPARKPPPRRAAVASAPRPRAVSVVASRPTTEPAPPRVIDAPPPAPGSDAAVLLGTIARAGHNDAAIDGGLGTGDGTGAGAARGSEFLRGGARGAAAPSHESRAAPAAPVEDYTRLVPPYSDAAIDHDVSAAVAVKVEVDEEGRVVAASLLKGAGYGLDEIALETVRKYRFHPARDAEGRPRRARFGWRIVWESHWKRLVTDTVVGHPACRGQGPMNLGEIHPVYIDCDGPVGYFELVPEQR